MTPAEELRAAAARIREVAGKATPGPWVNYNDGDRIIRDPDVTAAEDDSDPCGEGPPLEYVVDEPLSYPENGDHIAMWDPNVALLVAEVFDKWARIGELDPDLLYRVGGQETLAVARAINGGAS